MQYDKMDVIRRRIRRSFGVDVNLKHVLYILVIVIVVYLLWSVASKRKQVQSKAPDKTRFPALRTAGNHFMMDGKPLRILSGAIHYFRVPPASWRDRLTKLKAAGLNTVET